MGFYETFFVDVRTKNCNSFSCKERGSCGLVLVQTIYQHNLLGVFGAFFVWLFLHWFWSYYLYSTSVDFFRKGDRDRVDRLTIKSNWENCNLSAYHAVTEGFYLEIFYPTFRPKNSFIYPLFPTHVKSCLNEQSSYFCDKGPLQSS